MWVAVRRNVHWVRSVLFAAAVPPAAVAAVGGVAATRCHAYRNAFA